MWDALHMNYEAIENVKFRKVVTFTKHYENFTMKEGKSIDEMFRRFQTILNGQQGLGHELTKAQNNMKILNSLPKLWDPKTATIQEA
ncbi:hypothetical protein JHK82_044710 [Glycine max]|uniref:Uncharacterized protein n=1 Tax=Glycine max TaxID=3847 RepID=K7MG97_SOYBN|nr:hypothetical protein JHK86_045106 [Glycine max]KAG4941027.1 hypothetical protein JHK87_044898 [Glycine soja]KAG4951810.1 hypothetical protein JHK85_045677 [Glycine max]KAG5099658.1 hypothetical protein JHK82_044710 [Glycine max]KAG5108258.1 hypothetical protein JHK84_045165 [Glycine max]